jgi:hypothetical protein
MAFEKGFDQRGMPNQTPAAPPSHGSDGPGPQTSPAERPGTPAPAKEHGHQPVKGLKSIARSNPTYGKRK